MDGTIKKALKLVLFIIGMVILLFSILMLIILITDDKYTKLDYLLDLIIFAIGLALVYPQGKYTIVSMLEKRKSLVNRYADINKVPYTQIDTDIQKLRKQKLRIWLDILIVCIVVLVLSALIGLKAGSALFFSFLISFGYYFVMLTKYRGRVDMLMRMRQKLDDIEDIKRREEERSFEEGQRKKGLVKFENIWAPPTQVEKWQETKLIMGQNFGNIGHYEFEEFVAKLFRKMGYHTEVTRKTGDFGIDIIAKDDQDIIAVQCKQNRIGNNVGNVVVQQILGAMWKVKANKAIVVTTSDFTVQAKEQAREAPVELWNLKTLKQMVRKYFIDGEIEKLH